MPIASVLSLPSGPRLILLQEQATTLRGHSVVAPAASWPAKDPIDTVDVGADFRLLTGGVPLDGFYPSADGCRVEASAVFGTVAVVRVSGGLDGQAAQIAVTGAFNGGDVRTQIVRLPIIAQNPAAPPVPATPWPGWTLPGQNQPAAGGDLRSAAVNDAGHLILTRADGSTVDAGNVRGPAGTGTPGLGIASAAIAGGRLVLTLTDGSTADAGALPSVGGGLAAPTAATTADTAADAALLLLWDGAAPKWISVPHLLQAFGQSVADAGAATIDAPAGTDRTFFRQAGSDHDAVMTLDQIAAYVAAKIGNGAAAPPAAPAIAVAAPSGWIAGDPATLAGSYTGTAPGGVSFALDAGSGYTALDSFAASGGAWSGALTVPAAGSHTLTVREANSTATTATTGSFTVAAAPAPLLDGLAATFAGAYALRRLRSAHTDPVVTVRRSSDNTAQDFSLAGRTLNWPAVLAFCAGGDGFVAQWWDQSGRGQHLVQAAADSQPQIVAGGAPVALGNATGRPALTWGNAGGDALLNGGFALGASAYASISVAQASPSMGGTERLLAFVVPGGEDFDGASVIFALGNVSTIYAFKGGNLGTLPGSKAPFQIASVFDGSGNTLAMDGSSNGPVPASGALANGTLRIGRGPNTSWIGWHAEHLIVSGPLSAADQAAIRADQQAFYGTP